MDRRIFATVLVAIFLVAAPARAGSWADGLFSESAHDFGPVPRGAKVRHAFAFTNRTEGPITVVNVRASCGCTTGRATAGPIAPGASGVVEAEMDTRNFVGKKATRLFVTLADVAGKEAEVRLGVSSNILSDIVLNPGTVDFGSVARGTSPRLTLTIDRLGAPNWKATRMISASRALDATLAESSRTASGVGYTLTVALKADAPAGVLRDEIRILTNDPESPSIPVLVTAQVRDGGLTATPPTLALGRPGAGVGTQGRVLVKGPQAFNIVGIDGSGEGFQATASGNARASAHILTVTFRPAPGAPKGELRRTFRVRTDLPGEPPLEVIATVRAE